MPPTATSRATPASAMSVTVRAAMPAKAAAPACSTAATAAKATRTRATKTTATPATMTAATASSDARSSHPLNQKAAGSIRRPFAIRTGRDRSDHHHLGAHLHPAVEIDHVLVAHADA